MADCCGREGRRLLGLALALVGVLILFVCVPARLLFILLGIALTVCGLLLAGIL